MTVLIDIGYPFGYVHATPWGTHVNEGRVEWPLSPWRLLRALVATWRTRYPDLGDDLVVPVLSALAAPPAVRSAARTEASIRTYLPSEEHRHGVSGDTDLVVDAFVAVAPGTGLTYRWDIKLSLAQQEALAALATAMPYLGRAESICTATAFFDDQGGGWEEPRPDSGGVGVRTLVPVTPLDLDDLCVSIRTLRSGGRLHPRGARWVRYVMGEPITVTSLPRRRPTDALPEAVRFALSGRARVSLRQAVVVADVMRRAAMSKYGGSHDDGSSEIFAGKDVTGTPLAGNRHAHWLPIDLDHDRLIDTLLVWAPGGFTADEITALAKIRQLKFNPGDGVGPHAPLAVGFEGFGELAELDLDIVAGTSSTWRSVTPFLPQRHHHAGRESFDEFLIGCVARELSARGIEQGFSLVADNAASWGSFRRYRSAERLANARPGYGFSIQFDRPVTGPLCLGQLSHFGMGRFEPCLV
jgi:CRISPR-associated protein Csb2